MQIATGISIVGLTVRSPCLQCPVHTLKIPKSKSEFCKLCKPRFDYDELIKSGSYVYPFLQTYQIQNRGA